MTLPCYKKFEYTGLNEVELQDCSPQQPRETLFLEVAVSFNERFSNLYPVLLFFPHYLLARFIVSRI